MSYTVYIHIWQFRNVLPSLLGVCNSFLQALIPSGSPTQVIMSSKRKWDQEGPNDNDVDSPSKVPKTEDGKSASEAAAAAAAIAAKIAAQFAGSSSGTGVALGPRDPHDGDFTHDIDINDVRNRYLLTKGSTQTQVSYLLLLRVLGLVD